MAVTVDQVLDPLPVGAVDQPDSGQRYIGVQITLKNVGSVPYSDSPSNGATLLSNDGEQAQGTIVTGGPCGNDFQSSVKLAPGDVQQGCVPFEMAMGKTPSSFQFTLDSGFADQTGEWSLSNAPPTSTATSAGSTSSASGSVNGSSDPVGTVNSYWSDVNYQLVRQNATWLIEKANISPNPCR